MTDQDTQSAGGRTIPVRLRLLAKLHMVETPPKYADVMPAFPLLTPDTFLGQQANARLIKPALRRS